MKSPETFSAAENKKEQREIPEDLKEIYVLFHGEPYHEELSFDARLRGLAALEVAETHPDANIYFVGGGVDGEGRNSGSEKLYQYLLKREPEMAERMKVLGLSNNTAANLEEILSASNEGGAKLVISSEYHLNRIEELMRTHGLEANTIPAEAIVEKRSKHHATFVEKYMHSPEYKKKEFVDKLGLLYIKFDPDQKLVEFLRKYQRGFKHKDSSGE